MTCFYQHLAAKKSASEAVQLAMKDLREPSEQEPDPEKYKFKDEKYWAPFVLIGDDVTLDFGEGE